MMPLHALSNGFILLSEWKNEILEKEKQLHELKKFEEEHVQNLAKQLLSCQVAINSISS
jgi:hypothetical protein